MTAPREPHRPPAPPDRRPSPRGGHPSSQTASAAARPAGFARLAGARRGLVHSVRTLAAAALLALVGALALPATAQAQAGVLVSNLDQADRGGGGLDLDQAQAFTTGAAHSLTSVEIEFSILPGIAGTFTVSIWTDNGSDRPGAMVGSTLSIPSTFTEVSAFTTSGIDLAANTQYFIVVDGISIEGTAATIQNTASDDEDDTEPGAVSDWSIGDSSLYRNWDSTGRWTTWSESKKIRVNGTAEGGTTNNAPEFPSATATRAVFENLASGQNVGDAVTATDADTGDTLTYTLEGTDAASFDIVSTSGQIRTKAGVTYDYETTSSYSVTVKADDGNGGTDTIAVTIDVTDVNEQPDTPAKPTLAAVSGSSTRLVASWTEPGLNGGPEITGYQVRYRSRASATDPWSTVVDWPHTGTTTITGLTADTEYQVDVSALNGEKPSGWSDPSDAVRTDVPTITDVAVTSTPQAASDTYGAGETIEVTVTFTEAVTTTIHTDFVLSVGEAKHAPLRSGSGTVTLVFGYIVQATDSAADGIWIGDQDRTLVGNRNGKPQTGTITSVPTGTAADLTHSALGELSGHKVDGSLTPPPPTTCTLNTGDRWCGVVTVGMHSDGHLGFTDSDGALTDNTGDQTIAIASGNYTVSSVVVLASPAGALAMELDTKFPTGDEETLEFHIGGSTFKVSAATFDVGVGAYYWLNSGLSWSVGDMVDVRLRRSTDDDAPTISVQDQTVNEGALDPDNLLEDEGFPFQVTLSAASGQPVRYKVRRVELASDTATGDDLKHEILYLEQGEIAAGETSVYLRADIILDDTLDEPDETFTLEIYDFENATAGDQTRATITIEDDDDPPSVSVADAEATEGDPAEFAVTLSAASGQTVTVGVATSIESSDTAAAGDFTAVPATTLTFMPGDTAETVMVQTTADTLDEPDETFTLTLSSPSNVTLGDATAEGTITNNDNTALASVTIAADQPAFTAKLDDVTFTLTRTEDLAAALDVAVALTQDRPLLESEDLAQTVTFEAGEATATLIIRFYQFADHTVTEESTLTATVQTGSGYEPGSPNTVSTRIVVTDPAVTAWIEATAYTFAEDATGNDATIAVILRIATGVPVPNRNLHLAVSTQAISGQAESRVDYEPFTLQLEFQPSDFTSDETGPTARQEVTLVIVDDALDESDETLSVFLEPAPSLPEVVALRQPDGTACPSSVLSSGCAVTVTIVDNDSATNGDDDLIGGICARTPRVRDRILVLLKNRHSYKGDCSGVTETQLAQLQSLDLGRNPSTESAFTMSLQSNDFEGLVNLVRLYLRDTGLDSLPAGVFSGLAALDTLELDNNRLLSLPAGVFSDLLNLKTLELHRNPSLRSLPYDEFEALPNLTELRVDPEGRRGYQVAGGEGDATLEVAAGGTTTYQVRLTHTPAYVGTASLPTLTVSSDTAGVTAAPTTLRFTKENWFRRQTVTVDAPASAAGATATLSHTSVAVTYDRPIPTVTVRVLENAPGRAADPLTAEFQGLPSSHDGETAFSFRIAFSEAVAVTPEAMRTRVLAVAGGAVTGAARVDGESGVWSITVTPATREALSITLAPAAECAADGAVCTSDGRALSNGAAHIVIGPGPDEPEGNTAAAGAPTISGTPQVGEALTASTSDISDADGLDDARFTYQWIRAGADIDGATGSTYTPVAADEGTRLQVRVSFTDDAGHAERLTSAATDAVAAAPNTPAAGAPAIGGTAQVGAALTASTSGISDADGLDTARFAYQWIRTDTDIQGATGSTYTAVDADEDTRLKVRVSFTDDAGHAERLTSAATDAVAAAPEPLTASFEGLPAEHAGQGSFSFRVAFSDGISISYTTVRDASFTVTGGEVTQARRVDRRRDLWRITIKPDSDEAVTVRLPETTNCGATGAICTSDGRPLSHALSATIAGPVGIAVADARVEEGDGVALAFVVTLSRAASAALTVDYATADGSAHAGDDYRAASGTLTVGAGERSTTIEVAVLDDAHDEGEETLTLRLSNPSGGRLTDGEATGTIENHDPMPRALVARFGRTAAVHVVEHVEERLQAPRAPGFRGRFAGRELRRGMERDIALNFLRQLGGAAGADPLGTGVHGPLSGAPAAGTAALGMPGPAGGGGHLAAAGPMGGGSRPDGGFDGGGLLRMGLGGGDVLTGSDVALGRETGHGGLLSFWSRGAQSRFAGREGALSLGGDVRTTMVGADYATGPLVTGLSLSHSRGLGEYAGVAAGQVASSVTGLYPWLGYQATERVTVWGVAGYGVGGLRLTPAGRAGAGVGPVDGDGGGGDPGRAGRGRGGRRRAGVQGRCPLGRHVDRRGRRPGGTPEGDRGGGDPRPHGAGGLARLHARGPAVAHAERRGRAAARRRGRRDRRRPGRRRRAGDGGRRDRAGRRSAGADAGAAPGRGVPRAGRGAVAAL